jgi:hypothetical protein
VCQVKLCRGQNINTSRGFSALASTDGAFGNTGRASDSSELRRDFLADIGITYAVFRIAKSRLRHFDEFC